MRTESVLAIQAGLIDRKKFQRLLDIEKTAFFEWKKRDPNFPKPIVFSGGHTVRWRLSDAMQYANLAQTPEAVDVVGGGAQ